MSKIFDRRNVPATQTTSPTEIEQLNERIAHLERENAKLRKDIAFENMIRQQATEASHRAITELRELRNENLALASKKDAGMEIDDNDIDAINSQLSDAANLDEQIGLHIADELPELPIELLDPNIQLKAPRF